MRPMPVVVDRVAPQDALQVGSAEDEDPVEALTAYARDPALGMRLRLRCAWGCADDPDPLGAEDFVEGEAELAVAVADQEAHGPWVAQQARNLVMTLAEQDTPVRVRRDTGEVHASAL